MSSEYWDLWRSFWIPVIAGVIFGFIIGLLASPSVLPRLMPKIPKATSYPIGRLEDRVDTLESYQNILADPPEGAHWRFGGIHYVRLDGVTRTAEGTEEKPDE